MALYGFFNQMTAKQVNVPNQTGTTIKVSNVEVVNPPITVIANPRETSKLESVEMANGMSAKMVANAVINIGRKRVFAASINA
jgi:hypothetical protein